jgi:hypothetical protein
MSFYAPDSAKLGTSRAYLFKFGRNRSKTRSSFFNRREIDFERSVEDQLVRESATPVIAWGRGSIAARRVSLD